MDFGELTDLINELDLEFLYCGFALLNNVAGCDHRLEW